MLEIFYSLSLVVIILVNISIAELIHRRVIKSYDSSKSTKAHRKLRHLQYMHVGITLFMMFLSVIVLALSTKTLIPDIQDIAAGKSRFFLQNIYPFLYFIIIWTGSSMIYYKTYRILEMITDETKSEWVWKKFLEITFVMFYFFIILVRRHFSEETRAYNWILEVSFALFTATLLNVCYVHFLLLTLRTEHIRDRNANHMITYICKKHSIENCLYFQFPSIKTKMYNAYVLGIWSKKILISDYLFEHLSRNEFEAIITHEIGHLKKHHQLKQFLLISFVWLFFRDIASYFGIIFENMIGLHISTLVIQLVFVLISTLLLFPYISRIHERHADKYVVRSGISKEDLVSALQKLYNFNDIHSFIGCLNEKLSTHPSLENRIKYINEFAESMGK